MLCDLPALNTVPKEGAGSTLGVPETLRKVLFITTPKVLVEPLLILAGFSLSNRKLAPNVSRY